MTRLLPFLAALLMPVFAWAEAVDILVEERLQFEFGDAMPDEAKLRVSFTPETGDAVMIHAFWFDRKTGQFVADLLLETGELRRVAGLALITVAAPVPVRQMMPGEIVGERDIALVDFPVNRIGTFAVTEADRLIGQEVRRMLNPGRLVMVQSVQPPRVITRGERVKIILTSSGLSLSATGRALADAAKGEPVKVVNLASNRSVVGIAAADGIVEITQ